LIGFRNTSSGYLDALLSGFRPHAAEQTPKGLSLAG